MITVKEGIVDIPYPFGDGSYHFALDRAGEKFPNTNYSDWIIHLSGKTWAKITMLEELTKILKKEAPQIDWEGSLIEARRRMRR